MHAKITLLPGDGIGPEVVGEGVKLLMAVAAQFGHSFEFTECLIGGIAIDQTGNPLPDATLAACRASDAVLLGAVGGPKWSDPRASVRPEQGLLGLRGGLGLFANIRPVKVYPALVERIHAQAGGASRRRHDHPPRADRGPLLRQAAGAERREAKPFGRRHHVLHRRRGRAPDAICLRAGAWAAEEARPRWTRPTCWRRRGSGARSRTKSRADYP